MFMGQELLAYGAWQPVMDWSRTWMFNGITNLYRDLIHLRRNWFNNTRGLQGQSTNVFKRDNASKIIAYHWWSQGGPGDDVVVVLNFGNLGYVNLRVGFPRAGLWRVRFNSDWDRLRCLLRELVQLRHGPDGGGWDNMPFATNVASVRTPQSSFRSIRPKHLRRAQKEILTFCLCSTRWILRIVRTRPCRPTLD
jgi:1,4-alpha-glucan branching enzyme